MIAYKPTLSTSLTDLKRFGYSVKSALNSQDQTKVSDRYIYISIHIYMLKVAKEANRSLKILLSASNIPKIMLTCDYMPVF